MVRIILYFSLEGGGDIHSQTWREEFPLGAGTNAKCFIKTEGEGWSILGHLSTLNITQLHIIKKQSKQIIRKYNVETY